MENAVLKDKLEAVNYNLKKKNYNLVASLAAANDRARVYRDKWEKAHKANTAMKEKLNALWAMCQGYTLCVSCKNEVLKLIGGKGNK